MDALNGLSVLGVKGSMQDKDIHICTDKATVLKREGHFQTRINNKNF